MKGVYGRILYGRGKVGWSMADASVRRLITQWLGDHAMDDRGGDQLGLGHGLSIVGRAMAISARG